MAKKVIAAGHCCLDITPVFPHGRRCGAVSEILVPGKLIQMDPASVSSGGCVSNTGLALKLLGNDVTLMGKVGDDDFGAMLARIYARYGAEETRDVVIFADAGDTTIAIMPVAARYGDRWYLVSTSSMTSMILGIAVNCQAVFAAPEELAETVKGIEPAARVADLPDRNREAVRYEGSGFGTPEEAAEYYLEGLKNQNIQQMLGAFAWETQNSRYSLKDYILRMQCVNETAAIRMPAFSSLMAGSNLCSLRYAQANRIQKAVRCYVLAEADRFSEFLEGYNVSFDGDEDIDAFIALYDNDRAGKLAGMSGVRFADPASVIPKYDTEQTKELLGKYKGI